MLNSLEEYAVSCRKSFFCSKRVISWGFERECKITSKSDATQSKVMKILTIFKRLKPSTSGLLFPLTSKTSSLARACQLGCILSTIIVHVSSSAVVSCPAKQNNLHSAITSSVVIIRFWDFPCPSFKFDSRSRPNKLFVLLLVASVFISLSLFSIMPVKSS